MFFNFFVLLPKWLFLYASPQVGKIDDSIILDTVSKRILQEVFDRYIIMKYARLLSGIIK
ncbi:MAG: hypothetical protein ACR5K4_02695 [Sodalis sp. (in: enterobacteria)]